MLNICIEKVFGINRNFTSSCLVREKWENLFFIYLYFLLFRKTYTLCFKYNEREREGWREREREKWRQIGIIWAVLDESHRGKFWVFVLQLEVLSMEVLSKCSTQGDKCFLFLGEPFPSRCGYGPWRANITTYEGLILGPKRLILPCA